jgi:hypothetical protein
MPNGRCWTATKYAKQLGATPASRITHSPTRIAGATATRYGHLVFADCAGAKLQRLLRNLCRHRSASCGLSPLFDKFGLGARNRHRHRRKRGGYLPNRISSPMPSHAWFSGQSDRPAC